MKTSQSLLVSKDGWVKILIKSNVTTLFDPHQTSCILVYNASFLAKVEIILVQIGWVLITQQNLRKLELLSVLKVFLLYLKAMKLYTLWLPGYNGAFRMFFILMLSYWKNSLTSPINFDHVKTQHCVLTMLLRSGGDTQFYKISILLLFVCTAD